MPLLNKTDMIVNTEMVLNYRIEAKSAPVKIVCAFLYGCICQLFLQI